jgi:RNA polymerase sigma-70 factor (ECF subfamily)
MFDAHAASIEGYCRRRLASAVASDAAADVMLIAWRRIDDVPAGEAARLWLFGVARCVVQDFERSERRRARLEIKLKVYGSHPSDSPEKQVVRRAEDERLLEAITALRPKDREIVMLRLWDELSRSEVAALIGISEAGVDKRFSRALDRLRSKTASLEKHRSLYTSEGGEV